jgi:hypothetical protein
MFAIVCVSLLATQTPEASPPAAAVPATETAPVEPPPPEPQGRPDSTLPVIQDIAVAADNPARAPMITATLSDVGAGIGEARVRYRAKEGATWGEARLEGGTQGLFLARLPDGLQTSGFDYYVEVTDVAGNGPVRIGSEQRPLTVPPARRGTQARLAEAQAAKEVSPGIHPAWVAVAMGVGVLSGGAAGAFGIDLWASQNRLDDVNDRLAQGGLSDAREADLRAAQDGLQNAVYLDAIGASVLGVVAVAGLATGVGLLIAASVDE